MLNATDKQNLDKYIRAANYLTVAQIFLQNNFLLERPLISEDIKPRLLGHWGSCPGINTIYAHLNLLIKNHKIDNMMFVLGPGHGFPALQANLFLEGALARVDDRAKLNAQGIEYVAKEFSWPYGFPSHASPYSPGVLLEGGELGYSLSTAYGAVLDNPDLVIACLIGDGEAETGALASSWQLNKLVAQPENGVVLPILHLNGYKISAPTIFGRMSDKELIDFFKGQRYEPYLIDYHDSNDDEALQGCLDQIYTKIKALQGNFATNQRLPMLIFRSPKGMSGVDELSGQKIAGNFLAHQVVLEKAKSDAYQLARLERWLKSYNFKELFYDDHFDLFRDELLPIEEARMGNSKLALGKPRFGQPIKLNQPKLESFGQFLIDPGENKSLSMNRMGEYLKEVFRLNQDEKNFRFFSPDETSSNRLQAIYDVIDRAWNLKTEAWDYKLSKAGRSMEILNEQSLQGMIQGYTLTGRYGVLTSYEAFMPITSSMMTQHAKYLIQAKNTSFRSPVPSINYLLTSVGWRQDHNGFSHQNPSFIDDVLRRQQDIGQVFLPADDNMALAALDYCLGSKNHINVIVAGKTEEPRWRNLVEAQDDIRAGAAIWPFASDDNPDLVIAAAGDYVAQEALLAMKIIKKELPSIKLRFVYASSLSTGQFGLAKKPMRQVSFDQTFTKDKPIIFNFHGYPETIKAILFNYLSTNRATVHGYIEQGSTTTPFDMMIRNQTSRWHLAIDAFEKLAQAGQLEVARLDLLVAKYHQKMIDNTEYIKQHGKDSPEVTSQVWD